MSDGAPRPYPPALLARLAALAEADPGRETCGFVLRRPGPAGPVLEAVAATNAIDRYHAVDPVHFPRTSRDGYLVEPRELLRLFEELAATGGEIAAVWHSHVEAGAHFSALDRADALVDGAPVLPGAEYLVLGLSRGRVTATRRYVLEGGGFVEHPLA